MLEQLDNSNTIIIIGRANSGTRILPESMILSGIFMGSPLNEASDLMPTDDMYECCRIFGNYVDRKGRYEWDFSRACATPPPPLFQQLLTSYLQPIIDSVDEKKGWKIPNNTLIYPWLTKLLPNASFIHWVRHPESSCVKMTGVDRLENWNIPARKFLFHEFNYKMRAISWKYHYDIVNDTPRPKNFLQVRYEDYVLYQEESKKIIEAFIQTKLPLLSLDKKKAGPYSKKYHKYAILEKSLGELKYT